MDISVKQECVFDDSAPCNEFDSKPAISEALLLPVLKDESDLVCVKVEMTDDIPTASSIYEEESFCTTTQPPASTNCVIEPCKQEPRNSGPASSISSLNEMHVVSIKIESPCDGMDLKEFICDICGKNFDRKKSLRRHITTNHCSCVYCEKGSAKKQHNGEKRFSCMECKKSFTTNGTLTCHLRVHTGEKPFSCKECQKRFRRKTELTVHSRIHSGEKPFSCTECEKSFMSSGALTRHSKIHNGEKPFSCFECKKRFRARGTLKNHLLIHTEEKPYCCMECPKRFKFKGNLTCHLRIHSGDMRFSCNKCGRRFPFDSSLKRHSKTRCGKPSTKRKAIGDRTQC